MDYICAFCKAVKLSADSRGMISPGSADAIMLEQLRTLLFQMMVKGFASMTWSNTTHPEINPKELQLWVKERFRKYLRVEVMKDFFTLTVL